MSFNQPETCSISPIPSISSFESLIQRDIKGTLFYPMSGADVTPILICPNVDTFVFVDEHPLLNLNDEKTTKTVFDSVDQFVDQKFVQLVISGMEPYNNSCKFPLSFPMFLTGNTDDIQYDYSNPFALLVKADILPMDHPYANDSASSGVIHLLAMRLRDRTDFDVKSFEIVKINTVYKFTLVSRRDGSEKTLWYIKAVISKSSPGYDWLTSQKFTYDALLIKGYPYYANFKDTPEYIAKIDTLKQSILQVCGDSIESKRNTFRFLTDQKEALGQFADPYSRPIKEIRNVSFGYGSRFLMYGADSLNKFVQQMNMGCTNMG